MKLPVILLVASSLVAINACAPETEVSDGGNDTPAIDPGDRDGARAVAPGSYKLIRGGSGKCLDVDGGGSADGTVIHQWECNGTGAQNFRIEGLGNDTYRLVNPQSGKCVDVDGAGTADRTKIQLYSCNGSGAQVFRIEDRGGGQSRLRNPNSNRCVDVDGGSGANGAKVQLWSCNTADAQLWRTEPSGGGGGDDDGDDGDGGGTWRRANLTNFTSWPDPNSEECWRFNGCMWAGYFAFLDNQMSEEWVSQNNIAAVHSRDRHEYALKTLRLRSGSRQIDVKVYDMCSDSDCDGCCTQNASETGFLIDIESYTAERFGLGHGIVDWTCLDC